MAASLIGGLLEAGHARANLIVFEPHQPRAKQLKQTWQIELGADNADVITQSDVVVLAVKPQILQPVLQPLATVFAARRPLIISVVAGIRATSITKWLDFDHAIVRVMPNTPALIGAGASGLYANSQVSAEQRSIAANLLNSVGTSAWLPNEADIDSITALSGSGPAYFMVFIQSLINAAIEAGIEANTAKTLAVQTALGSAQLIAQSEDDLARLIEQVTSPNGTTQAALQAFADAGLAHTVQQAFTAAKQRSEQLANELD